MMGFEIIGTGHYVPGKPYTNDDLTRVMDTSDEWIFKRSGIRQRHFAPEGESIMVVDAATGARADPVLVDRNTGRLLQAPEFIVAAGPAASERMRRRHAHPNARKPGAQS